VRTDTDESRGSRVADGAARAGLPRFEPPLTGGRRVPGRKDSPHGTAGNFAAARFAQAPGAFQVLMRAQYLRTQLQGGKRIASLHGAVRITEIVPGLRGMGAAARAAGLSAYAQMCQRVAAHLELLCGRGGVSLQLLCELLEWLAASACHLRRPESLSSGEDLRTRLLAIGAMAAARAP
jgi:hypothetical protein